MRRGFTLIELLVVIAIIAILAAILFPVFARAREKARMASCLSNVKEMALGVMMYSQDHDETTPGAYGNSSNPSGIARPPGPVTASTNWWKWPDMIYPYVKNLQIFHCPSGFHSRCDYNANRRAMRADHNTPGTKLATLPKPAETIGIYDSYGLSSCGLPHGYRLDSNGSRKWCYGFPAVNAFEFPGDNTYAHDYSRHNNGCNYSFMDGHAKWLQNTVTYCALGSSDPNYRKYWQPQ